MESTTPDIFGDEPLASHPRAVVNLSLSSLAWALRCSRETIRARIAEAGLEASNFSGGHPLYSLREVLSAWMHGTGEGIDPDRLPQHARLAYFKAENEKLKLSQQRGSLCVASDVEREFARILKLVALELDTVVDEIERDVGASPLVLEKIEAKIDAIRERMHERMTFDPESHNEE